MKWWHTPSTKFKPPKKYFSFGPKHQIEGLNWIKRPPKVIRFDNWIIIILRLVDHYSNCVGTRGLGQILRQDHVCGNAWCHLEALSITKAWMLSENFNHRLTTITVIFICVALALKSSLLCQGQTGMTCMLVHTRGCLLQFSCAAIQCTLTDWVRDCGCGAVAVLSCR